MPAQGLQAQILGTVTSRRDPNYDALRRAMIWNALKPARYPDFIVQAACEDDIIETVKFARTQQLKIAVRGGGHSWCAPALREGGILLDLSQFQQLTIDPKDKMATVQPAVSNGDFARQLAEHDLAFPVGHCPSVPLSGFILGGGFGWNASVWGVSCWSLVSLKVVTAEGNLVTAHETENQELFWAARGAGPEFFGVATEYQLKLYPLPRAITTSTLLYPLKKFRELVKWVTEALPALPKQVELRLLLASNPGLREGGEKVCVLSATAFVDSDQEAIKALSAFAHCPVSDGIAKDLHVSTPFEVLFENLAQLYPPGKRYAVDNLWSESQPLEVLSSLPDHFTRAPSAQSLILCQISPTVPADAPPLPDAAFSMMAPIYMACYAIWEEPQDDVANTSWLRTLMKDVEPLAVGHYVGESDIMADPCRLPHSFKGSHWQRLQTLGQKYDPDGVFHRHKKPAGPCVEI